MKDELSTSAWGRVFNTPLECGLRSAALLLASYPEPCDMQRLVQYDYLIVHSGDVDGGPSSIHPATPHRSGELLVRRSLVEAGVDFMMRRRVIEQIFSVDGIGYTAGEYSVMFLESLTAEYSLRLRDRAKWVVDAFQTMSDDQLAEFMKARWSTWGADFVHESLLEGADE